MDVRLLGPVELWHADRQVPLGPRQQRCVLAVLAISPRQPVSTEVLVDRVWGQALPADARSALYTNLSRLRSALRPAGGAIQRQDGGYQLDVEERAIDLHRARAIAAEARALTPDAQALTPDARALAGGPPGRAQQAIAQFRAAEALWRASPLADLRGGWAERVRLALSQERLAMQVERFELELAVGQPATMIGSLSELHAEHPLSESVAALLMRAHFTAGHRSEALGVYAQIRRRLVDTLGVEPCPALRRVHRQVLQGEPGPPRTSGSSTEAREPAQPGAVGGPPPERVEHANTHANTHANAHANAHASAVVPAQLPPDVAGFTGREQQLARLEELRRADADADAGIAVVEGTAGVGKTALAVRWGHRVRGEFPDGQLYLDLRGYGPEPPMPTVDALARFLRAFGVPAEQVPSEVDEAVALYRSLLADRRVLVVLDNAAGPEQVRPLLPSGDGSLAVVTSRDQLTGLVAREGAHRLNLDVLRPGEARALLASVVGQARARAEPEAVAQLAALCGQLPLALRIAGANLAAHPSHRVAEQVEQVRERLASLAVPGDAQHAVSTAFDHSYTRLPEDARRMFRLIGLVPGGDLDGEAAATLAGTTPEQGGRLLVVLAGAHLVEERTPGHYGCHDLLRRYAADRVAREDTTPEQAAARARLYEYYLERTDAAARCAYPQFARLPRAGTDPGGTVDFADAAAARTWLDAECDNLVAAVCHADASQYHLAVLLADYLRGYLWLRMNTTQWLATAQAALAAARVTSDKRGEAAAHLSLGMWKRLRGDQQEATEHATRARDAAGAAGWDGGEVAAWNALGTIHEQTGRLTEATDYYRQALARVPAGRPQEGMATILVNLSIVCTKTGQLAQAAEYAERSLEVNERFGSASGVAINHLTLGNIFRCWGRLDRAVDHFARSVAGCPATGSLTGESIMLSGLAAVHLDAGRLGEAVAAAASAVRLACDSGDASAEAGSRSSLASVQLRLGDTPTALAEGQRALALAHRAEAPHEQVDALLVLATGERHQGSLDRSDEHASQALAITRRCGFRILEGDALTALAAVQLARGDAHRAASLGEQARAVHHATGYRLGEARALLVLGHAGADTGNPAAADHRHRARTLLAEVGAPEAAEIAALLR